MNVNNASFIKSCVSPDQYPETELPELALAGRSNVGKSSLINALTNRKNLAYKGKTPGVTTLINFFNINNILQIVDLPGYGYAAASKSEREAWGPIIETYLTERSQLKMIIMIVDIRHKPTDDDVMMYDWIIHRNLPHFIVAAKADKISRNQQGALLKDIRNTLSVQENIDIIPLSALKKTGINETWTRIQQILNI